jgi:hypothetical protein
MARLPPGQDGVSSGRLVKGAKASAGPRVGTSGKKSGHAHLKGAFAEAAALFLRHNPVGQKDRARLEKKPDQGKALPLLAHQLARAVYDMLKRPTAFDREPCRHGEGSRAGEPHASLDPSGSRLHPAGSTSCVTASGHAQGRLGLLSRRLGPLMGYPLWLLLKRREAPRCRVLPLSRA